METKIQEMLKQAAIRHLKFRAKWAKQDIKEYGYHSEIRPFSPELKFYPRLGLFKANNVSFDPIECVAVSYNWWLFVKRFGKVVVFNDFSYSVTTSRHQNRVSTLMRQLGIEATLSIEAPGGLQDLDSAIRLYKNRIQELQQAIDKRFSRKAKNKERRALISDLKKKIKVVERLNRGK